MTTRNRYPGTIACSLSRMLVAFLMIAGSVQGQSQAEEAAQEQDTSEKTVEILVIPASDVPVQAEEAAAFIRRVSSGLNRSTPVTQIESQLKDYAQSIRQFEHDTQTHLQSQSTLASLEDLSNGWLRRDSTLKNWQEQVSSELRRLDRSLSEIDVRISSWELTRKSSTSDEYPQTVVETIRETLKNLRSSRKSILEKRGQFLSIQNEVIDLRSVCQDKLQAISLATEDLRRSLLSLDGPPIWRVFLESQGGELVERLTSELTSDFHALEEYVSRERRVLVFDILFFLMVLVLLFSLKRNSGNWAGDQALSEATYIVSRPFSSAILIAVSVSGTLHVHAPAVWTRLLSIILIVAFLRLLPGIVPREFAKGVYVLLGLMVVRLLSSSIPTETPLGRLITLALTLGTIALMIWFRRRVRSSETLEQKWRKSLSIFYWVGVSILFFGTFASVLGGSALARVLSHGVLRALYIGVLLGASIFVTRGVLKVAFKSKSLRRSRIIRLHEDLILRRIVRIFVIAAVIFWTVAVLRSFVVYTPLTELALQLLTTPLEVGEVSVSLGDILILSFSIWGSFLVSRFVCFILDEDFLPRLSLPRGIPATISRLTYYVILFIGFLIAISAAGIDLSRFAIVAGAFGVGIGFGLQNIVNNFVSGLILLFERPIQVGDKIQVGELTGEVLSIGARASIVRTFDGAEVIVPNGNLIAGEVVNWTLRDLQRRVELPVGVAYGTDPENVITLLTEVASNHPDVLKEPAPQVLFVGFGESSLDFSVRAWVGEFDKGFQVRSQLAVLSNRALKEAGIEIPFPQRDLHLRSVDPNVQIGSNGRKAKKKEPEN